MSERTVTATRFKTECFALLNEVAATGVDLVVTKRGKPIARVVPARPAGSLEGSVTQLVGDDELIHPVGGPWPPEATVSVS